MNKDVDKYVAGLQRAWQRRIVTELRGLVHDADSEINEVIKWGTPGFDNNGPVAWMFCAREWVHFAFPQGALLNDKTGIFIEGMDTTSKAKRTLKFRKSDKVPRQAIVDLVEQAVANNKAGKKIKFDSAPRKRIVLSEETASELKSHGLEGEFWQRPYYQQKGYVAWIESSKQDTTRVRRTSSMIEELQNGSYMPPKRDR